MEIHGRKIAHFTSTRLAAIRLSLRIIALRVLSIKLLAFYIQQITYIGLYLGCLSTVTTTDALVIGYRDASSQSGYRLGVSDIPIIYYTGSISTVFIFCLIGGHGRNN